MSSVTAIAWVPCAPMLVPEIGTGGSAELAALRDSVSAAVGVVLESAPEGLVVVAPTAQSIVSKSASEFRVSFHGFGLGEPPTGPALPWQLGLGAWLLAAGGWTGESRYLGVGGGESIHDDLTLTASSGRELGLLVLADGACHGDLLTGADGDVANAWDEQLAEVLSSGDPGRLGQLDTAVASSVMSNAAEVWPAAARLLGASSTSWTASLVHESRRWDVGYLVANWT